MKRIKKRDFSKMRRTSLCGLFMLFVHFCLVHTGNTVNTSSDDKQPQQARQKDDQAETLIIRMRVSPTWYLSEGDTVEINCTTIDDKGNHSHEINLQLVRIKIGPGEKTATVLQEQKASTGINYILGPVTHEHQGVYSCGDDGSVPDVLVNRLHRVIWVADSSPRAFIDVTSHNRSQFLSGERFTVSCQLPNSNPQWKMLRYNEWWGTVTECPGQVSLDGRLSCSTAAEFPWAYILYWCQDQTGGRSNALNISAPFGLNVTLESPTLPVLEGEDVVLRCLHLDSTTNELTSNFRAVFHKNNRRIRIQTEGSLTLTSVTKADEGMYVCRHPQEGPSNSNWISVKARPEQDQKRKADV